eukprot:TRINITY_DN14163_c0_g1_i1.p1 TRINITY_DN14163_c0_g1~~TRINITY_DN14163_c0_g1_i1.p1  ORF type:complete len:281 (-),score=85.22 TRINITY_DN14163_c0_g1_i1:163-1005(-)
MQVTVLEATHNVQPPQKPVIAVQVGASPLRQASADAGRQFLVPRPGEGTALPVEVQLWRHLASGTIAEESSSETLCSIPVNGTQVKLRVSRTGKKEGIEKEATAKMSNEYLDKHKLQAQIQGLLEDVLRVQPDDPFRYMITQLQRRKGGDGSESPTPAPTAGKAPEATKTAEATPAPAIVPKAPAGPPPDKKAPRNFGQGGLKPQAAPAASAKGLGLMVPAARKNSRDIMEHGRQQAKVMASAAIGLAYRMVARREAHQGACRAIASAYKVAAGQPRTMI